VKNIAFFFITLKLRTTTHEKSADLPALFIRELWTRWPKPSRITSKNVLSSNLGTGAQSNVFSFFLRSFYKSTGDGL